MFEYLFPPPPPKYRLAGFESVVHERQRDPKRRDVTVKWMIRIDRSRYSGAELRALRAERGCGRPPAKLAAKAAKDEARRQIAEAVREFHQLRREYGDWGLSAMAACGHAIEVLDRHTQVFGPIFDKTYFGELQRGFDAY